MLLRAHPWPLNLWGAGGVQPSSPGTCKEGSVGLILPAHGLIGSSCLKLALGSFLSASGLEGPSPQCSVFFCHPIPRLTSLLCPGNGILTCSLNGVPCQQLILHLHRAGGTPGRKSCMSSDTSRATATFPHKWLLPFTSDWGPDPCMSMWWADLRNI